MLSLCRFVALVALASACVAPSLARAEDDAQTAEARKLYGEAKKAMSDKKYKDAALGFEAAGKLKANAVALYTAAQAWELAGEPARAADMYALALETPKLSDAQTQRSQERLRELQKTLGVLVVTGAQGTKVQLDEHSTLPVPAKLHAEGGEHRLVITRPDGTSEKRAVALEAGQSVSIETEDKPEPQPDKPEVKKKIPMAEPHKHPVEPESGPGPWKTVGFLSLGAGIAALGGGVLMWGNAKDAEDTYKQRPSQETYDHAKGLESNSNILIIGGSVLTAAGAGLVIWQTLKKPKREGQSLAVRAGPGALWAEGRF